MLIQPKKEKYSFDNTKKLKKLKGVEFNQYLAFQCNHKNPVNSANLNSAQILEIIVLQDCSQHLQSAIHLIFYCSY